MKKINLHNKNIILNIWDSAGQERFKSIAKSYFNKSDGVVLVFDLTNIESFNSIENWMEDLTKMKKEERCSTILIGNKSDLIDDIVVKKDMIEALVKKHKIKYFETSAKENKNIKCSFECLAKEVYNKKYLKGNKHIAKNSSMKDIHNPLHNFVNFFFNFLFTLNRNAL